ncbi:MAG: hypothetical protein ACUVT1_07890 [Anaerolineae bacterium]
MKWSAFSAWLEIIARVFEGFDVREDFAPAWMQNPYTGRRLKLDRYYPELGIAVRFVGGMRTQSRRISDEEAEGEENRDAVREWLCRRQGVTLVRIDPEHPDPRQQVGYLRAALSRTSRVLAQSDMPLEYKQKLAPRIAEARRRCDDIARRLARPDDLHIFAELWQDRQYAALARATAGPARTASPETLEQYRPGISVHHAVFGPGVVEEVVPEKGDARLVVRFADGQVRQFLASLVGEKLWPA